MGDGMEAAIFVVNKKIEADPVMQHLFKGNPVYVYPGYADEPSDVQKSYPYIRYHFIPVPMRALPYLRKDWCQYFVGDTDLTNVINMAERLTYLLNLSELESLDIPAKDVDEKFKIMDIMVHSGTIPNVPSQDLGVWEQGVSFTMRYTIRKYSWHTSTDYSLDALIQ